MSTETGQRKKLDGTCTVQHLVSFQIHFPVRSFAQRQDRHPSHCDENHALCTPYFVRQKIRPAASCGTKGGDKRLVEASNNETLTSSRWPPKGVLPLAGRQPKFSSTGGVCRSPKRATIGGLPRGSGLANIAMDEETSAMQPLGVLNGKKALRGAESYEGEWLAAVETLRPHSRVRIRVGKTMYSVRVHDTMASYEYTFPILPTGLSSDSALESSSGSHVHLASASMLWDGWAFGPHNAPNMAPPWMREGSVPTSTCIPYSYVLQCHQGADRFIPKQPRYCQVLRTDALTLHCRDTSPAKGGVNLSEEWTVSTRIAVQLQSQCFWTVRISLYQQGLLAYNYLPVWSDLFAASSSP
ncbi:uncharacterized protein TRIVIDRAFT_60746 [Trichoderma virens Gv29-8]|uniref:Uncharacterized protein n=1 Tax=Hypocrea virens (strain Gv29-8 / FGSC 10586) TaxID=413071 RepID=G9MTP1_HYPVG|nr:uncharacterized protein TRIVIDRAFT_60746 [Trichoderma virens Gv29-8]EHK22392.1 hypothetical protein TRIVIDRAFT_60746 [Trichoderma virens Gv29-8]UKZ47431.1 hypothetical protein TrVGV298_001649 [Trichoderma virens]